MKPLKYFSSKPKIPGWYWLKDSLGVRIVMVRWYAGELCIDNWQLPEGKKWAGPISRPIAEEGNETH